MDIFGIPIGCDFRTWLAVGRLLLAQTSPYAESAYYNPVWLAPLFVPFVLLPEDVAWAIFLLLSISGYTIAYRRLTGRWSEALLLMMSPYTFQGLGNGNIDWLVLLGGTLPPQLGVWLLTLKPQASLGVLLVWAVRALRQQRFMRTFGPVTLAFIGSYALGYYQHTPPTQMPWNAAIWPWGIPLGIMVLVIALCRDNERLAWAAGPLLAPYVAFYSWYGVLIPLKDLVLVAGFVVAWVLFLL